MLLSSISLCGSSGGRITSHTHRFIPRSLITAVVLEKPEPHPSPPTTEDKQRLGVVSMGEGLESALARGQPLCVTVSVDTAECVAHVDRRHRWD